MAKLLVVIDVPDNEADDFLEEVRSHLWWATVTEVDLSADELSRISQMHNAVSPERRTLREAAAQMRGETSDEQ